MNLQKKKSEELVQEVENEGSDIYTQEDLDTFNDWDVTLMDGLDHLEEEESEIDLGALTEDEIDQVFEELDDAEEFFVEEWDEDHALDQVMNDMVSDMDFEREDHPSSAESVHRNGKRIDEEEDFVVGVGVPSEEPKVAPKPIPPIPTSNNSKDEEPIRYKKGPLWQYRTNKVDNE